MGQLDFFFFYWQFVQVAAVQGLLLVEWLLFVPLNAKAPSNSDNIATAAAFTLASLAAASLSCFLVSGTKRMLTDYEIQFNSKTRCKCSHLEVGWWMSEMRDLKSLQSCSGAELARCIPGQRIRKQVSINSCFLPQPLEEESGIQTYLSDIVGGRM